MKLFRNIGTALVLMVFIISFAVTFTLNFRPLYYFDMNHLNISQTSGLSNEDIKWNYNTLIDYNSALNHEELSFPTLSMSESGRIHFAEVKDIFVAIQYMFVISAIIGTALIILLTIKFKDILYLKLTAIFTVAIPAALGLFIASNWDKAFVTFHHIFFNNDYWMFSPETDPIINILPDEFFLHCAIMILFCTILGSGISYLIYRKRKKIV